jgi:hypothetical protein
MRRVTGIGGIFFKARDPSALYAWYEEQKTASRPTGRSAGMTQCGPSRDEWGGQG